MWWLIGERTRLLQGRGPWFESSIAHNESLWNNVENRRAERETYHWNKTRSKKINIQYSCIRSSRESIVFYAMIQIIFGTVYRCIHCPPVNLPTFEPAHLWTCRPCPACRPASPGRALTASWPPWRGRPGTSPGTAGSRCYTSL